MIMIDDEFRALLVPLTDEEYIKLEQWIIDNQLGRRNISIYDRSLLALKGKAIISAKAKEKQKEEGKLGGRPSAENLRQKSDKGYIDTKKELAKQAKVSHDTIHKVEVIEKEIPDENKEKIREQIRKAIIISEEEMVAYLL